MALLLYCWARNFTACIFFLFQKVIWISNFASFFLLQSCLSGNSFAATMRTLIFEQCFLFYSPLPSYSPGGMLCGPVVQDTKHPPFLNHAVFQICPFSFSFFFTRTVHFDNSHKVLVQVIRCFVVKQYLFLASTSLGKMNLIMCKLEQHSPCTPLITKNHAAACKDKRRQHTENSNQPLRQRTHSWYAKLFLFLLMTAVSAAQMMRCCCLVLLL